MMSLFSSPFYARQTHEPSLVPLFRLLDDFEHYAQDQQVAQPETKRLRRSSTRSPTFKPKFDVHEIENTYELHGELAGIQRENLNIEFTDPRTIQISGRIERTKEQQPTIEEQQHPEVTEAEKTNGTNDDDNNNHHATVEDDPEEETASNKSWTRVGSPKPETAAEPTKTQIEKAPKEAATPKKNDNAGGKIWLWERSIGEFSRTFTFPRDVEHNGVSASLNNGILSVTVPKKAMHQPRRIAVL
ncbi:30 kDa heat shock protein [Rhypophila decipiens]|uniref:30 kDa heat shock protein n=1 Tax=Rhypophila decipiens TaxID=261697 RepID=A0AAN6XW53_9PEZI|nr:30 kDa heat shock protein [Rhypophila decipiens]